MIDWKPINEYVNANHVNKIIGINAEPEVLLYSERTGVVTGKALRYSDGDIITIANGYHGFSFTHFAHINIPE